MDVLPPPVMASDFRDVDSLDEDQIEKRFAHFVRQLHVFLNHIPCLSKVQQIRKKWVQTRFTEAFGPWQQEPRHWYTFNHGGRNEAQFNVGLYPEYLRIGLGFEMTLKKGGDPDRVMVSYACFVGAVRKDISRFRSFVEENRLEVEWVAKDSDLVQQISTDEAVDWLLDPRDTYWIFIGRLLRPERDSALLNNPKSLGIVMATVLCGLAPYWKTAQQNASRM